MIGPGTRLVEPLPVQDDQARAGLATGMIVSLSAGCSGFISVTGLAEAYEASRDEIAAAFEGLLQSGKIVIENPKVCNRALAVCRDGWAIDFVDALNGQMVSLARPPNPLLSTAVKRTERLVGAVPA